MRYVKVCYDKQNTEPAIVMDLIKMNDAMVLSGKRGCLKVGAPQINSI